MEESLKSAKASQTNDRHQKLLKDHFYKTSSLREKGESDCPPLFSVQPKKFNKHKGTTSSPSHFAFILMGADTKHCHVRAGSSLSHQDAKHLENQCRWLLKQFQASDEHHQ